MFKALLFNLCLLSYDIDVFESDAKEFKNFQQEITEKEYNCLENEKTNEIRDTSLGGKYWHDHVGIMHQKKGKDVSLEDFENFFISGFGANLIGKGIDEFYVDGTPITGMKTLYNLNILFFKHNRN